MPHVHCSTTHKSHNTTQPTCLSTDGWIKKTWYVCTVRGIVFGFKKKKKEMLPFVMTWMDLEGIMLHEVSQTQRQIRRDLLGVESKAEFSS